MRWRCIRVTSGGWCAATSRSLGPTSMLESSAPVCLAPNQLMPAMLKFQYQGVFVCVCVCVGMCERVSWYVCVGVDACVLVCESV